MNHKYFSNVLLVVVSVFLFSCLDDPGMIILSADKSTVSIGEEVTLSTGGAENFTCINFFTSSDAEFTVVSGGEGRDKTITLTFASEGTYLFEVAVKNCRGDDDPCSGRCRDEYAQVSINVE